VVDFSLPMSSIEELAGRISDLQAERLTLYANAMLEASSHVNLVSRRTLEEIPEHLTDSAALLAFADPGEGAVADLGSGGGLPGIVVAILRPQARVTLVDSRRSKIVFLKDVTRRLGLDNVEVIHDRIETLAGRVEFPLAVARALGDAVRAVPLCMKLLSPEGRLVLFKGPAWNDEAAFVESAAAESGAEVTRTEGIELPGFDRVTTFVEFHVKHV
jgi:16S rRNA (guanine527-N7)-methyltransferase